MGGERDEVDVLIVGAGVAGLVTALSVIDRRVTILCPRLPPAATASALAQGGIAAAVAGDDDPELHLADTLQAGAGECRVDAARILCMESLAAIRWVEGHGVRFDRVGGHWAVHHEAAHRRARVLHIGGDRTGATLTRALYDAVCSTPRIEFLAGYTAVSLSTHAGRVTGTVAFDAAGRALWLQARDTVLATGGIGQLYSCTTNPRSSCGDGLAMALEAGARATGLEFVQFHPTALSVTADPLPLATEALRGDGATLVDERRRRFMAQAHPLAELAPRDIVAREIWKQLQVGHRVYLNATRVFQEAPAAYPSVRSLCARSGIDPERQPLPIVPAAHYHMGGVAVDLDGRASIPSLWACGEVACSGVHGANRLASNSLLEAVVFGRRLGAALASAPRVGRADALDRVAAKVAALVAGDSKDDALDVDTRVWSELRRLMWGRLGIVRDARGLQAGLTELAHLVRVTDARQLLLLRRLRLARAMISAALSRRESKGAHLRLDRPRRRHPHRAG